jgi:hypothetical protein
VCVRAICLYHHDEGREGGSRGGAGRAVLDAQSDTHFDRVCTVLCAMYTSRSRGRAHTGIGTEMKIARHYCTGVCNHFDPIAVPVIIHRRCSQIANTSPSASLLSPSLVCFVTLVQCNRSPRFKTNEHESQAPGPALCPGPDPLALSPNTPPVPPPLVSGVYSLLLSATCHTFQVCPGP